MALSWIFVGQVSIAITVLLLRKIVRLSGVQSFLAGLKTFCYQPPSKTPGGVDATVQPVTRKDRKLYAKQQALIEEKGMMEGMVIQPLGRNTVQQLTYADEFDFIVMLCAVLLVNTMILSPVALVLKQNDTFLLISNLCILCIPYMAYLLLKVELTSEVAKASDKLYLMLFGSTGFFLSLAMLTSEDKGVFRGFNLQTGIDGVDLSITSFLNRVYQRLHNSDVEQPFRMDARIVSIYLSIGIACLAATLVAPALRFARVYYESGVDRPWGKKLLKQPTVLTFLLPAAFLLPLIPVLLQFRFVLDFWAIPTDWAPWLQPLCYLLTAATHIVILSPMCQTWLNGGLVDWYKGAHNGVDHPRKAEIIVLRLQKIRALLCKVATQLLGLAPLVLSAGILMAMNSGWFHHLLSLNTPLNAAALDRNTTAILEAAAAAKAAVAHPLLPMDDGIADEYDEYDDDVLVAAVNETVEVVSAAVRAVVRNALPEDADMANSYYFIGEYLGWWCSMLWCLYTFTIVAVYRAGLNAGG